MNSDLHEEIMRLYGEKMAKKAIARKLGISVKTVRRVIKRVAEPHKATATKPYPARANKKNESKLAPYIEVVDKKVAQGLTGSRILREIGELGYTGGRTILMDHIREVRGLTCQPRKTFRRFETEMAFEAQCDWSPFRIVIAGKEQVAHCFAMVLAHSRYLFIQFHRDEKLPTLLATHVDAFRFMTGIPRSIVYDNMATVVLGRSGRQIIWNPRLLEFARHYLYEPVACRPYHPDRKGKCERVFSFLSRDFLEGRQFESWQDLNDSAAKWLRNVANRRLHSTINQVPEEAWMVERDFLTALPEDPFPVYRQEIRSVYADGTFSLDGTRYSVPCHRIGKAKTVTVRVYSHHLDILDFQGRTIATHRKPDVPGGLVLDKEHYAAIGRKSKQGGELTEIRFLNRFPDAEIFLDGLKRRMKSLYRIHLLDILRMAYVYGDEAVAQAIARACRYGNFNAYALRRILQERFPQVWPGETDTSGLDSRRVIGDVEIGDFSEYKKYSRDDNQEEEQDNETGKTHL